MIKSDEFELGVQNVFRTDGKQVVFGEVLSKFPGKNTQKVICLMEKTGSIFIHDLWVTSYAVDYCVANPKSKLSVNLSAVSMAFSARSFIDIVAQNNVQSQIIFELTETASIEEEKLSEFMAMAEQNGIMVAFDDYNHQSDEGLSILSKFQPDIIKLVCNVSNEVIEAALKVAKWVVLEKAEATQIESFSKIENSDRLLVQGWDFHKSSPLFEEKAVAA